MLWNVNVKPQKYKTQESEYPSFQVTVEGLEGWNIHSLRFIFYAILYDKKICCTVPHLPMLISPNTADNSLH